MGTNETQAAHTADKARGWALAAMCASLFMVMLDTTSVNVALPSIQRTFHSTTITIQWVVNAYTLAFAVLLIVGGRLGDLFGRRRLFLLGIAVFSVASAAIAVSPSAAWVLAWRAVQGVGAALLVPATIAIIVNLFAAEERGKAIGIWTGVSGIALALGPVAGGFLCAAASWRLIFILNLPVAVVALLATRRFVPESRDPSTTRTLDMPGVATLTVGLSALTLGLVEVINWHAGSPREIALFSTAVAALTAFVLIERRSRAPMIEFHLFRSSTFLISMAVVFVLMFLLFGTQLYISLYLQNVRNLSPLATGLRFMPAMIPFIFTSPIAGRLTDRFGARPIICSGLVVIAAAAVEASFITVTSSYWVLAIGLVLLGIGLGMALPASSAAGYGAVSEDKAGVAGGILNTARMIGGVLGIVSLGVLMLALASHKLSVLAPFLPKGSALQLANKPPSVAEQKLAPPEFLYHVRFSFVWALQRTFRAAAVLPLVGAVATWVVMGRSARHGERELEPVAVAQGAAGDLS